MKRRTLRSTSATEIASTFTVPFARTARRLRAGSSSRQGSHHVAKKCTSTTWPPTELSVTTVPLVLGRANSGCRPPVHRCNSAPEATACGGDTVLHTTPSAHASADAIDMSDAPRASGAICADTFAFAAQHRSTSIHKSVLAQVAPVGPSEMTGRPGPPVNGALRKKICESNTMRITERSLFRLNDVYQDCTTFSKKYAAIG
jgi:hypothetical protein